MKYPFRRKWNKFGNKSMHCFLNHKHDSKMEAEYCNQLLALKRSGDIIDFEIQVTFDLIVNDVRICGHRVDFVVEKRKGDDQWKEVHEVKGFGTMMWYYKRKLFEALFPEIPYLVIKKHDIYGAPVRSKRKTRRKKNANRRTDLFA